MAAELLDPYATLGVARSATIAQISRAYHRLAKELHPDLRGEGTAQRMREVNAAWEILSDPGKRSSWDRGQAVMAAGVHWTPATRPMRQPRHEEFADWPAQRLPRRYAVYPPRPRADELLSSDSPWLVGGLGLL